MRSIGRTLVVFGAVAGLLVAGCTGGKEPEPRLSGAVSPAYPRGGTLRGIMVAFLPETFDPQKEYTYETFEMFRCCLLRTLLSNNGRPTEEHGAELKPDLGARMPKVSDDGLTWIFRLRRGLHYAPPLQHTEIVAQDIVRALVREADPNVGAPYAFYYSVIEGFDDYAAGRASSISGLRTPDAHTLVVELNEPTGDLGYRLALPAAAPIPPLPDDPAARLGVATGHDGGYGRFLVASGPYMFTGSERLDFSAPPAKQKPVGGYVPFRLTQTRFLTGSVRLVRNPSWNPAADPLRGAYVDRIEMQLGERDVAHLESYGPREFEAAVEADFRRVERGEQDLIFDTDPPAPLLRNYRSHPQLADRLPTNQILIVNYVAMNLALPPFDDIHVRKAFSLALDKEELLRRFFSVTGTIPDFHGRVAAHLIPDVAEGDLLLPPYRPPWATANPHGDVRAARNEMRHSTYDSNGDGLCDDRACKHVLMVLDDPYPPEAEQPFRQALGKIGIDLVIRRFERGDPYARHTAPGKRVALTANRWFADYADASNFITPFSGHKTSNFSLLGATNRQLRRWGYLVHRVESVDRRISQCSGETGSAETLCWAELDKYLMERVVPWVPFLFQTATRLVSKRVIHYSFDQAMSSPALDQIALKAGSP